MKVVLETERLLLREFIISDAISFYELNSDKEVMKYTGDIPFKNVEEAQCFLENYKDYTKNGFGRWAVICKDTNTFIGWCGLKRNEENLVDIGFRFFKNFWNKGYATEAAKACLYYGFNSLGLKEIIGRASIENVASIRVLEKLEMKQWKKGIFEGVDKAVYYIIDKSSSINNYS
ncbi:GCN5-related N-acetyltransferase [Tenacibaculum sp. 190524A02b]|uniref:(Ribosomal protein S5)-alanine N-acetyltransferase n=1 Tax=Tenacibaculum vairaonense TaxID=3137860 RepID=A0ABP1FFW1_9FLAO